MTQEVFWPDRGQYHVLTYAEEGFSPLNIHAEPAGLTKTEIVAFAAMVNERGEAGSLHPRARISAIPRTLIRDAPDKIELQNQIVSFFHANSTVIKATRIAFDFRTPRVNATLYLPSKRSCVAVRIHRLKWLPSLNRSP